MSSVCIYLQIHQPFRVKRYRVFDIGNDPHYFNDASETDLNNARIMRKVARKSYIPTTELLLELLHTHPDFKVALSISGVALDQFEVYAPEVLYNIKQMVATGRTEILSETYYHSLAFWYSREEFEDQVAKHGDRVIDLFGVVPQVFRNTELTYSNDVGQWAEEKGFRGVIAEGWEPVLGWRSPNFVYRPHGTENIALLLKNYKLSDDVAFRFSQESWEGWPLDAETYAHWISSHNGNGETINLFMDFETFGEHQWEDTGIFDFLRALPGAILRNPDNSFKTPSETIEAYTPQDHVDVPHVLTWADTERDLSAWLGNDMQTTAIQSLYALEDKVLAANDISIMHDWRKMQTSDHFYYMCTKWSNDGDVHAYFSPYESPYEAYMSYMNALKDLRHRVEKKLQDESKTSVTPDRLTVNT